MNQDLFGNIIQPGRFVRNRTNTNKEKLCRLSTAHIIPSHNIIYPAETNRFLKEMLELHSSGISTEKILYYIGTKLIGKPLEEFSAFSSLLDFEIPTLVAKEHDLLGSVYQYLTVKRERLERGSFYTNKAMIEDIIAKLNINSSDTLLDPACGSGNLLLNSKISNPAQIYGIDNDPIAIMCCKFNYYLKFGNDAPEPQIFCKDFIDFVLNNKKHFDYTICNPPFGATLNISSLYSSTVKTEDSLTYFVEHASLLATKSVFILPESVLNVKKHTALREWMINSVDIENITSYGTGFSGTMFPIVAVTLSSKPSTSTFTFDGKIVFKDSIRNIPFYYLRPIDGYCSTLIRKVFEKQTQSLKDSIFALGVVTGDNKTKLYDVQIPNSEPIITGKDITPFKISAPKKFIIYDRNKLQQVAPDKLYRSEEKLVYKTVSRDMIFAIDYSRSLTLNSANFIIPRNLTISTKCLMALLNSDLYNILNKILFGENKVSRTNLENLPLPDISKSQQKIIENCIDKEDYKRLNEIIYSIFDIDDLK